MKSLTKREWGFFPVVGLIIILTLSTVSAATQSFHDGFEYGDTLSERGYVIDKAADPDMIADSIREAASTGERGLLVRSELSSGAVSITREVDIEYRDDLYLSFHVRLVSGGVTFRIELVDTNNQYLSLDFGKLESGWESQNVYDVSSEFILNEFLIVNENIDVLILEAIGETGSIYSGFNPVRISKLIIFQDNYTEANVVHFDEISVDFFGHQTVFTNDGDDPSVAPGFLWISSVSTLIILSRILISRVKLENKINGN